MADIDELERRVRAALDRIGAGVEALAQSGAAPTAMPDADGADRVADLEAALEDEKLANAQLEERIRALKDQLDTASGEKDQASAAQREAMAELDTELQKLRKANDLLRESNEALRAANAEGVGEPHLINKAMLAELESIRAARATDAAEARALMSALDPLLAEAAQSGEAN